MIRVVCFVAFLLLYYYYNIIMNVAVYNSKKQAFPRVTLDIIDHKRVWSHTHTNNYVLGGYRITSTSAPPIIVITGQYHVQ